MGRSLKVTSVMMPRVPRLRMNNLFMS